MATQIQSGCHRDVRTINIRFAGSVPSGAYTLQLGLGHHARQRIIR